VTDAPRPLRFAVFGAGFWARFQLAAWREVGGVECVAIFNRSRDRAQALADAFSIPSVYDDPSELLGREQLDFVDIITSPGTHRELVELVAGRGIAVISQKPMAESLADAEAMVAATRQAAVPFLVHENFRWQRPIREVKSVLDAGTIGTPFRARLEFSSAFPVFDNQPFLAQLDQFILTDVGTHILDVARFLFGECRLIAATTDRIHPGIRGEDVATVLLESGSGVTVVCELSYASALEVEAFPETVVRVEGSAGSVRLGVGYDLRVTSGGRTVSCRVPPPHYPWADPAYDLVHASIVPCNADLLRGLRGGRAETTGADNLETLRLVFGAYDLAADVSSVQDDSGSGR
jgi:predicted dehydrogenase